MIAEAKAQKFLGHQALKGRIREILLEGLLKPLAPPAFFLGGGLITDHIGQQSSEIDIVIANRNIVPHMGFGSRDGIFPVESVNYAFEVKSVLAARHIEEIIGKFTSVHRLSPLAIGNIPEGVFRPVTVLFAYEAPASLSKILDSFAAANRSATAPVVQVVCIPGRGYWRWVAGSDWIQTPAEGHHNELLSFVSGVTNTMFAFGGLGTKFGRYIS